MKSKCLASGSCLVAATAVTWCAALLAAGMAQLAGADEPAPSAAHAARSDPDHLWNRLRQQLHVRTESEIAHEPMRFPLDPNEHDPLHWTRIWFPEPINYLVKGKPHREAVALLDEFLVSRGERLNANSLERAFLQHDLWAVFDYVSDPQWLEPQQLQNGSNSYQPERRELYRRLATMIKRLALSSEQIDSLPDNYAQAARAGNCPTVFDSANPGRPFLPPDLWDPEGPWVLVGEWATNPLVIRHTAFFGGRSTFAAFLRLPAGRDATLAYLEELRNWKPPAGQSIPPNGQAIPPQVPGRTQFALARRMLAIDNTGNIVPTQVTESVQIRVLPEHEGSNGDGQKFFEFRLRRLDLMTGAAGGLTAVASDERDRSDMLDLGPRHDEEKHEPILRSCRNCHSDQGILSMNSYTGSMDNVSRLRGIRSLVDSSLKSQEDAGINWKHQQFSWGLLSGLMENQADE